MVRCFVGPDRYTLVTVTKARVATIVMDGRVLFNPLFEENRIRVFSARLGMDTDVPSLHLPSVRQITGAEAHWQDGEEFLTTMGVDCEFVVVIRMDYPLVEELGSIDHGDVFRTSHEIENVVLSWERV